MRLTFIAPSRGLFGYRGEFLSDTRGDGVLHRTVRGYEPWSGDLEELMGDSLAVFKEAWWRRVG